MVLSMCTGLGQVVNAATGDLTVVENFATGSTKEECKTGSLYTVELSAKTSTLTNPRITITIPKYFTVNTYPDKTDATIGPLLSSEGVTKTTDGDGNTVIDYHFVTGTDIGFSMSMTPTHKLKDSTQYTVNYELLDGSTSVEKQATTITTWNPTLREGAGYGEYASYNENYTTVTKYNNTDPLYQPITAVLYLTMNHYSYSNVKLIVPLPAEGTVVAKSGTSYTPLTEGQVTNFTGGKVTYYGNYDSKCKALVYELPGTSSVAADGNYQGFDTASSGNLYLKYDGSTAAGQYLAPYRMGVVANDGTKDVTLKALQASSTTLNNYTFGTIVKEYVVGDYVYSYFGADSDYVDAWTYLPGNRNTSYSKVLPDEGLTQISGKLGNHTGETLKNVKVSYTLPEEVFINKVSFNLGNVEDRYIKSGYPTQATVEYKTKNGGDIAKNVTLSPSSNTITLDASDVLTSMIVVYNSVGNQAQTGSDDYNYKLWTADMTNKNNTSTGEVYSQTKLLSATGTNAIGSVGEQEEIESYWYLITSYELNPIIGINSANNSSAVSVSKGDSFLVCYYSPGKLFAKNMTASALVPAEYTFEGVKSHSAMKTATYDLTTKDVTIPAELATEAIPAGEYKYYTLTYNDGKKYSIEYERQANGDYYDFAMQFSIGPLVDTSSLKANLTIPVVAQWDSGTSVNVKQKNAADIYDVNDNGNKEEILSMVGTKGILTVNSAKAISSMGYLTSSYQKGESKSQNYDSSATGVYKYYLNNGQNEGSNISKSSVEIVVPKKGTIVEDPQGSYISKWNAVLTGAPVLTGSYFDGATIEYKSGTSEYSSTAPTTAEAWAHVTKVKVTAVASKELAHNEHIEVDLPFKVDIPSGVAEADKAYFGSVLTYEGTTGTESTMKNIATMNIIPTYVTGNIFMDANGNGTKDADETALTKAFDVVLYEGDTVDGSKKLSTIQTDSYGDFTIPVVGEGQYTIQIGKATTDYYTSVDDFDNKGCYTFTISGSSTDKTTDLSGAIISSRQIVTEESIVLDSEDSTTAQIGTTITPSLTAGEKITYKSNDTSVVTVSDTGVLTYVGNGSTTVTVTVPQLAAVLAMDRDATTTVTKVINVNCNASGCNVTANPYLAELNINTGKPGAKITTQTVKPLMIQGNVGMAGIYYVFNRTAGSNCTKADHNDADYSIDWKIVSDDGAAAQIQGSDLSKEDGLGMIVLAGKVEEGKEYTVVVEGKENWVHDGTAPAALRVTFKFMIPSGECNLESFQVEDAEGTFEEFESYSEVSVTVPSDTDLTKVTPTFTVSDGATLTYYNEEQEEYLDVESGVTEIDFSGGWVEFVVTSDDGNEKTYYIQVGGEQSSEKAFTSFAIGDSQGVIDEANHTITVEMPKGTVPLDLTPTFTVSDKAKVFVNHEEQVSGETSLSFASPVTYTVEAQDNSTQDYVVTITFAKDKEATPEAIADYDKKQLTNLTPNGKYTIEGEEYTADENGKIALLDSWYGKEISIVKVSTAQDMTDSLAQKLTIESLSTPPTPTPGAPTPTPVTPSSTPVVSPTVVPSTPVNVDITNEKTVLPLLLVKGISGHKKISLTWLKDTQADGYDVYWAYCDGKINYKFLESSTSLKMTHKNLNNKKAYKYFVASYKMVDGKKVYLRKSAVIHVSMKDQKETNVKKVKVKKSSFTLSKGKTTKIKVTYVKENSKKKLLTHAKKYRFYTTDASVATVSSTGKIKAVKKGTCKIYAVANNGAYKTIKVKVK